MDSRFLSHEGEDTLLHDRPSSARWILVFGMMAALFTTSFPVAASAAPVFYVPLPGEKTNTIDDLTVASDGTLWVAQELSMGPANSERHMRFLHVGLDGTLLGTTPEQEGDPLFSEVVAAADGGIWANTSAGIEHIAPDGSVDLITSEYAGAQSLVAGRDGRAWLQHCGATTSQSGAWEEHCVAVAVNLDGEVDAYPLPGVSDTWPPGTKSAYGVYRGIATESGVWFWKLFEIGEGQPVASAEFISYQGVTTPITDVPTQALPMATASGDAVWWLHNELLAGATIGQIDPLGQIGDTHHMDNLSQLTPYPDLFGAAPGRDGSLVWAQNATWNEANDGQIGLAGLDGSNTSFLVEHDATAVPTSTPDFWSGSCTFGVQLFQATDGSLWTISGGHPPRLTRQQLDGQFSTFLLDGASEFVGEEETGVAGMDESSPHELWFMLNTPHGPALARLDPLDPPPAEPRMPEIVPGASEATRPPSGHSSPGRRRSLARVLNSILTQVDSQLRHHGRVGNAAFGLRVNFGLPGTFILKITGDRGTRVLNLTSVRRHAPAGQMTMVIPFRRGLRRLLRAPSSHTTLSVLVRFRPSQGAAMTKRSVVHFAVRRRARDARMAGGSPTR
jgi:hypothetical protein